MQFEYDPEKSKKNKEKHGIDFEEAQKIWESDHLEISAKSEEEARFIVIGKILEKIIVSCFNIQRRNCSSYFC